MKGKSLYDALGLAPGASQDEIKRAYRKLAKQHHPDKNQGDARSEARFKEVSAAYEVLSDAERRALYDEFGEDALRQGFDAQQARAAKQWQQQAGATGFGGGGGAGFSPQDIFGDLFNFGRAAPRGGFGSIPRRGAELNAALTVDFMTAALGGERTLRMGDGGEIKVRIPAGVENGGTLRLRGKGGPGEAGGPPGDLMLEVRVQPHEHFRREGDDLHLDVPLTLGEALRGCRVTVPTLGSEVEVKVAAGAQTGRTLRLRGKGITRKGSTGDLYLHLQVYAPQHADTAALHDAIEAIEAAYGADHPRRAWAGVKATA